MTRIELHELAVICRQRLEDLWMSGVFNTKSYSLHAKCRGLVVGDRMELAIFHHDNEALKRRAFDD